MEEIGWLIVCYPGGFEIDNKGRWSFIDGRIDERISFPIRVLKKISFVDLYDKLIEKLKIDSNLYEIVLRCPNPISSKLPSIVINDDESVDWLISNCHQNCLHVNLKSNANEISGTNRRVIPMHNEEEDINCVANDNVEDDDTNWEPEIIMNDNVDVAVSPLVGVTESVGVVVDVSDTLSVPIDTSHVAENMADVCADSLSDRLNDIEPTGVAECDNVIPSSSDRFESGNL